MQSLNSIAWKKKCFLKLNNSSKSFKMLTEKVGLKLSSSSSSYELRRSVWRHFLLRHDKKLAPLRFVHHHLSYLSCFERFLARLKNVRRNLIEICRPWCSCSKRWFDPWFINYKSVGGFVFRHADTVTGELKSPLADWYLASKLVQDFTIFTWFYQMNTQSRSYDDYNLI